MNKREPENKNKREREKERVRWFEKIQKKKKSNNVIINNWLLGWLWEGGKEVERARVMSLCVCVCAFVFVDVKVANLAIHHEMNVEM